MRGAPVAMGASLGALAMLHAQHRHPGRSRGCSCNPGASSRRARHPGARLRALGAGDGLRRRGPVRRRRQRRRPGGAHLRNGGGEHRQQSREWPPRSVSSCDELGDLHNYTAWRDAFDPHLTDLLGGPVVSRGTPSSTRRDRRGRERRRLRRLGPAVPRLPAERGNAWEYGDRGLVDALAGLIDGGRAKLYCVDSFDGSSWSNSSLLIEERARAHERYEAWILEQVVRGSTDDSGGDQEIGTFGVSLGAYHAVNIALRHADVFRSRSASRATTTRRRGTPGASAATRLLQQPVRLLAHAGGGHLDWLALAPERPARLRAGHVEGLDGRAAVLQGARRPAAGEGDPLRAGPLGTRRPARLALLDRTGPPPSATVLLRRRDFWRRSNIWSGCCSAPRRTGRPPSRRSWSGWGRSRTRAVPRTASRPSGSRWSRST